MALRKCDYFSGERCSLMLLIRLSLSTLGQDPGAMDWDNYQHFGKIGDILNE